jgi:hypothetical protein
MKFVYVAGPFRAKTQWEIHQNVIVAEKYGLEIAKLGAFPIIPHKNTESYHSELPDFWFLNGYLELLVKCDAMFLLPNWENSKGTLNEINLFNNKGLPIFTELSKLKDWVYGLESKQLEFKFSGLDPCAMKFPPIKPFMLKV